MEAFHHYDSWSVWALYLTRIVGAVASGLMFGGASYLACRLLRRWWQELGTELGSMWLGASVLLLAVALRSITVVFVRIARIRADAPFSWLDFVGLISSLLGVWAIYTLARIDAHRTSRRRRKRDE